MSGKGPSAPYKGKAMKKPRKQAQYVIRVPDTQPLADSSTRANVRSSLPPRPTPRPTPPTIPTTPPTILTPPRTIRPTPSIVPPTPNPIVDPTPIIDPSPSIPKTSSIRSTDVQQSLDDVDDPDDMIDPFPHQRPSIEPYGKGFLPSRVASQAITRIIKQQFLQPWTSWGAIPEDDQENFWKRFKKKGIPEHEVQIKRNFHSKASHRLLEMFRDARITGERPYWVGERIWNSLLAHWNTPAYRVKCATAQKNRASEKGGAQHTGGSITTHEHAIRMHSWDVLLVLMRCLHKLIFGRGLAHLLMRDLARPLKISTRLTQARSEVESTPDAASRTDANEDIMKTQCWVDVVGGKKKGRFYGAGQLASNYSAARGGILKHQPSTSNNTEQINMVSREAYDAVITRLKTLEDMFKKYIPQEEVSGPSSSHQPHSPTQPMQPTRVQKPVQQQLPQDEEEEDDDSHDYTGY
ncbi:hypothetical protein LR48_Vigan10g145200 [Vigna angularis]|uniref:Uncharacterized protein n=1 Tax=Phaseolus angularis TaxID=3914 RepID=A0A0L9VKI6_PHAAN|nr:hypothetical protein LR48_Vigan10g145200 [Vigna angularis]